MRSRMNFPVRFPRPGSRDAISTDSRHYRRSCHSGTGHFSGIAMCSLWQPGTQPHHTEIAGISGGASRRLFPAPDKCGAFYENAVLIQPHHGDRGTPSVVLRLAVVPEPEAGQLQRGGIPLGRMTVDAAMVILVVQGSRFAGERACLRVGNAGIKWAVSIAACSDSMDFDYTSFAFFLRARALLSI